MLSLNQAIIRACKESTLIKALAWIANYQTEFVIQAAARGLIINTDGRKWECCFETCFKEVIRVWNEPDLGE